MKSKILIAVAATLLAACSNDTPQYAQPAPAPAAPTPVVIQQGGSDAGDMLAAGAVGMIAGQALANRQQPAPQYNSGYSQGYNSRPVIKHKTVIVQKNVIVQKKVVINKSPSRSFSSRSRRK